MATLPEMQPLVKGGHARMPDRLRSTLFRRQYPVYLTVPSFLRQPTPQSPRQIHQTMDGSFQNFYAFNYLLKGLGMHQTWITAVDLRKLFEKYGAYPHGNFLLLVRRFASCGTAFCGLTINWRQCQRPTQRHAGGKCTTPFLVILRFLA